MSSTVKAVVPENTIADDKNVTKYKMAGAIHDKCMEQIIIRCVPGAMVFDICKFGDELIVSEVASVYKKEKEMDRGVAFPTSISVNNIACHFSPLESEKAGHALQKGDMVKIDFGLHIDGFIATAAHTLVVGATKDEPVTGKKADALKAAHYAAEASIRLIQSGNKTSQITEVHTKIAQDFKCNAVEGMLSHQLKQNVIDGEKTIVSNPGEKLRQEHKESEIEMNDVFAIDNNVSTGDGHVRESELRCTIFKRNANTLYHLKMKASRAVFTEVEKKHKNMCFTLRMLEDEKRARMGINECVKHDLCSAFPVVCEKEGESIAQFKYTVLLMPNGPLRITKSFYEPKEVSSEYEVVNEDMKAILAISMNKRAAKRKKKKNAQKAAESVPVEPVEAMEAA